MASMTILSLDENGEFLSSPQLLKSPSIAQTALTAAQLMQNFRDVSYAESTVEICPVGSIPAIEVEVLGVAANNAGSVAAATLDLYEFAEAGHGFHVGQVSLVFGNFTTAATTGFHANTKTHAAIRNAFAAGTAYRGVDTYTEVSDYPGSIVVAATQETDFPGRFIWTFANTNTKYVCALATSLGNAAATSIGAIFKPLGYISQIPYGR